MADKSLSTNELPLVSVVVPTRDRPDQLRQAIRAILDQNYEGPIECIVVFDQTAPNLPSGLNETDSRRIITIENSRSPGLAGARNTGILRSTGELIAFCDDDDYWMPGKLKVQVNALIASPAHNMATVGIRVVGKDGTDVNRALPVPEVTHEMLLKSRVMEVHSSTLLFRRDALIEMGMVDEEIPGSYAEDYELLLRASQQAPILVAPGVEVVVDFNPKSYFTDQWRVMGESCLYLLDRHPDLQTSKTGHARILGRLAIVAAATHERRDAVAYAAQSLRLRLRQHRSYVALAISAGLLSPDRAVRMANRMGRGI